MDEELRSSYGCHCIARRRWAGDISNRTEIRGIQQLRRIDIDQRAETIRRGRRRCRRFRSAGLGRCLLQRSRGVVADLGGELGHVGALDLVDLLAGLEELEGGHGRDAALGRDVFRLVDIAFRKDDGRGAGVLFGKLVEARRDDLTGPAPGGVEIDDEERVGFRFVELRQRLDFNHLCGAVLVFVPEVVSCIGRWFYISLDARLRGRMAAGSTL